MHVMQRPVICKDRIVRVGIEAEVSVHWAGKEGAVVNSVEEIESWLTTVMQK